MSLDFQAVGRDVQSQADSAGDSALASAVKSLVQWFAGDAFSDGLWHVKASASASGASLSFELVEAAVYVAPSTYEDVPATAEELARSAAQAPAPGKEDDLVADGIVESWTSPVEADPAEAPAPAEPAAAVEATPNTPAVDTAPVDPPVAAPSSDVSSGPQSTSSTPDTEVV